MLLYVVLASLLFATGAYAHNCTPLNPIYYASECLARPECGWCCERPVGQQCFPLSASPPCGDEAILRSPNMTCDGQCYASGSDCDSCEGKNWCYFCISQSLCQAPHVDCAGGEVIQSCAMRNKLTDNNMMYFKVLIYVGIALIAFSIVSALVLLGMRVRQRMREEETHLEEPFLAGGPRTEEERPNNHHQSSNNHNTHTNANSSNSNANSSNSNANSSNSNANSINNPNSSSHAGRAPPPRDGHSNSAPVDAEGADSRGNGESGNAMGGLLFAETREETRSDAARETGVHVRVASAKMSTAEDESLCFLCLDASPSVTFLPCYHTCCCEACSVKIRPNAGTLTCPFCRVKIAAMVSLHSVMLQASTQS